MANPFYVDPGRGVGQELGQLGKSLAGLGQLQRERQQVDQQKQAQAEGRQAVSDAFKSNDPDLIAQAMIDYPEMAKNVQGAINYKNDVTRNNMVQSAREIVLNPENAQQTLMNRVETVMSEGGDPTESILALKELEENPESFMQNVKNVFATNDPQGWQAYQSAQPQQAEAPEPMTEYQSALVRQKESDQQIRRLELEEKKTQNQIKRETDDLKRQELQEKIDASNQERKKLSIEKNKSARVGIQKANQDIANVDELLSNKEMIDDLTGISGSLQGIGIRPTQDARDAQAYFDNIKNSLTVKNLSVMSGPLTDTDIKIIASSASKLREGISKELLEKELKTIKEAYSRVKVNYQKQLGIKPESSDSINLSDDEILNMYLP